MAPTSISTSHARLICLCSAIDEPGTLLKSDTLPIHVQLCHCNPCRQSTGSLGASFPPLRSAPSQKSLDNLIAYHSSDILTRYFCATCGCHCFMKVHVHGDNGWRCLGGIIEKRTLSTDGPAAEINVEWPDDTIVIANHDYITDTIDGGITPMLRRLHDIDIPLWKQEPDFQTDLSGDMTVSEVMQLKSSQHDRSTVGGNTSATTPGADGYLRAQCHCGGVNLLLQRPAYAPDLEARYVGSDRTRFLAYPCACRSCRLSTGVPLLPFACVPADHIFNASVNLNLASAEATSSTSDTLVQTTSTPATEVSSKSGAGLKNMTFGDAASTTENPSANPGQTLHHFKSSDAVYRTFCGKCGATVFYWNRHRRDEVDVAVGILRSEEGSMLRSWLAWDWGRCSFSDEVADKAVCDAWGEYREE